VRGGIVLSSLTSSQSSLLHTLWHFFLLGDYGLLMLTAYNSTSTQSVSQPRPKVTLEHQYEVIPCESIGTIGMLL